MRTECISDLFGFAPVEGRRVEASFVGGTITSPRIEIRGTTFTAVAFNFPRGTDRD